MPKASFDVGRQFLNRRRQIVFAEIQRGQVARQIAGMAHGLFEQFVNLSGIGGFGCALFGQPQLQALGHQRHARQFLPEVIVQIQADAPAFFFGDIEQLMLQPAALGDFRFQPRVGRRKIRRAFLARGVPVPRAICATPPRLFCAR